MITTPDAAFAAPVSPWRRIVRVVSMVRYRFFLYAGLLPYLLGATWAYAIAGRFDTPVFWTGLSGVILAVIGVEAFNEYFDARMGTDRVFNPADLPPISVAIFWIGVIAFAGALAVGVYLTLRGGPWILAFALLGVVLLVVSARRAFPTFEQPRQFVAAVRAIVACYVVTVGLFVAGLFVHVV